MNSLTIGAVAKLANVNTETMRYYERRGLILRPPRSYSNYRLYPPDTIQLRKEFMAAAKDLTTIYIPDLCLIAELDGKPVGWLLVLPDINHGIRACNGRLLPFGFIKFLLAMRKKKEVATRVITLGILPEARGRGLDALLIAEITRRVRKHGSPVTELGWVLEDNTPILNAAAEIGAKEAMRYRLYAKDL